MEIYQKLITSISKKTFGRVFREECPRFSAATNPPLAMLMSARENHDAKDLDIGLFLLSLSPPCQAALKVCTELLRLTFHKEHDGILQELERGAMVQMKVEIEPILDLLHHDFGDLIPEDVSAIRRRCAWLLFKIGNCEAINALKKFASCGDDVVEIEALERLQDLGVDISELGMP